MLSHLFCKSPTAWCTNLGTKKKKGLANFPAFKPCKKPDTALQCKSPENEPASSQANKFLVLLWTERAGGLQSSPAANECSRPTCTHHGAQQIPTGGQRRSATELWSNSPPFIITFLSSKYAPAPKQGCTSQLPFYSTETNTTTSERYPPIPHLQMPSTLAAASSARVLLFFPLKPCI